MTRRIAANHDDGEQVNDEFNITDPVPPYSPPNDPPAGSVGNRRAKGKRKAAGGDDGETYRLPEGMCAIVRAHYLSDFEAKVREHEPKLDKTSKEVTQWKADTASAILVLVESKTAPFDNLEGGIGEGKAFIAHQVCSRSMVVGKASEHKVFSLGYSSYLYQPS